MAVSFMVGSKSRNWPSHWSLYVHATSAAQKIYPVCNTTHILFACDTDELAEREYLFGEVLLFTGRMVLDSAATCHMQIVLEV